MSEVARNLMYIFNPLILSMWNVAHFYTPTISIIETENYSQPKQKDIKNQRRIIVKPYKQNKIRMNYSVVDHETDPWLRRPKGTLQTLSFPQKFHTCLAHY